MKILGSSLAPAGKRRHEASSLSSLVNATVRGDDQSAQAKRMDVVHVHLNLQVLTGGGDSRVRLVCVLEFVT